MMSKGDNFQKRAVKQITPAESIEHQVRFEPQRFDSLVFDKGYDTWIDRAYRCPCSIKGAGQPMVTCNNCLGVGWIFRDRIDTRVAIQTIKADIRFENWTKTTAGTAKITARAIDKLAFMDRVILKDVEGYYNEIVRTRKIDEEYIGFLEYPLIDMEDLLLFDGDKEPLINLQLNVDYIIVNESKIIFLKDTYKNKELTLSARYKHFLTYHIIEMNRDIIKVRQKGCLMPEETLRDMPINGIMRKAHYLFDNYKYEAEGRLIEN